MRSGRTLSLALVGLALLSCQRKAPGPEECLRFAETVVGISRDDARITERLQASIDEETRTCLTRPYDRALILCVQSTGRAHSCIEAYKRRSGRAP